ncbi:platelet endothelial aggregation receptor 1-like [Haliotis cracherodii]|uniref:platelet endothelial aggregation receptor 1-like n=1 Tax=Haliotis cracherodii TaxID=6455 RepID=UPI0039E95DA4
MGGTCFSGCSDSYYGTGCTTCSSRCKSCNRITGTCEECQPPYSGLDCRSSCEHCVDGCESGCQQGCRQGFYGDNCTEACSDTCRADPSLSTDEQCPEGDSCTPECHSQTGECVHGCVDGWYGPKCSRRCISNCKHQRCNSAGACIEGCAPGQVRFDCELCLQQCLNLTCALNNGSCCNGCNSGLLVESCNLSCNVCLDGIVGMNTSVCIHVKNITQYMCGYNCTNNGSSNCPAGSCDTDSPPIDTETVKYLVVFVICILAASTVGYCCYRRGLSAKVEKMGLEDECSDEVEARTCQHSLWGEVGDQSWQPRQSDHIYSDINEDDMGPVIVFL